MLSPASKTCYGTYYGLSSCSIHCSIFSALFSAVELGNKLSNYQKTGAHTPPPPLCVCLSQRERSVPGGVPNTLAATPSASCSHSVPTRACCSRVGCLRVQDAARCFQQCVVCQMVHQGTIHTCTYKAHTTHQYYHTQRTCTNTQAVVQPGRGGPQWSPCHQHPPPAPPPPAAGPPGDSQSAHCATLLGALLAVWLLLLVALW